MVIQRREQGMGILPGHHVEKHVPGPDRPAHEILMRETVSGIGGQIVKHDRFLIIGVKQAAGRTVEPGSVHGAGYNRCAAPWL